MKSLAAEQIKVARILLNLGHSYLHSISLENSEDEEEGGEEEEEECVEEEEEEEKEKKSQHLDELKHIFKQIRIESPVNIVEELEIDFDRELERVNREISLHFNTYLQSESHKNAHIEDIYSEKYEFDKEFNNFDNKIRPRHKKTDVQEQLNKQVHTKNKVKDKLNKNNHIEFVKEEHQVEEEKIQRSSSNIETLFSKFCCSDTVTELYKNAFTYLNRHNKSMRENFVQQFDKFLLHELNGKKVLNEFDIEKQKRHEQDKDVENELKMLITSEFQHGLDVKLQEKSREKQLSQKQVEIELGIEVKVDSEFRQEQDEKVQEELYRKQQKMSNTDVELGLNIEMLVDSECQQELNKNEHEEIDRRKIQTSIRDRNIKEFGEILLNKYDKKRQLNIDWDVENEFDRVNGLQEVKKEVQKDSYNNLAFYKENQEIQELFNDKMDIVAEFQQDLIKKQCDENKQQIYNEVNLTCNGKLSEEFNTEKRKIENIFDQKKQFNSEVHREKLRKYEDEQQNIERDIQLELHKECNGELLQEFDKEKQEVKQQFVKELQFDLDCNSKQQNMPENDVQNVFDENTKHIYNSVEIVEDDLQTEFDKKELKFLKTKTQQAIEEDVTLKCNENVQLLFNKGSREIDEKTPFDSKAILKLELELEAQKKVYETVIDTFHREIQQRIKSLVHNLLYGEKKISKEIQYESNRESYVVESIKQIQQEIEELQNKIREFDQDQDEELERNIIENIGKTYYISEQVHFLRNLLLLLCQESLPFYERIDKLCDLYFPTMCKLRKRFNKEIQTDFEKGMQHTFNKELLQKLETILQQNNIGNLHNNCDTEAYKDVNEITCHKLNEELQEVNKVQQLFNNSVQLYSVNDDTLKQQDKQDIQLKFLDEFKEVDGKVNEEINGNIQEKCETIKKEIIQNFDIVIQYNSGIQQNIDGKAQNLVQGKVQIDINEQIMKKLKNKILQNVDNIEDKQLEFNDELKKIIKSQIQQNIKKKNQKMEDQDQVQVIEENIELKLHNEIQKVENKVQKMSEEKVERHMQQKVKENMEVDFNEESQMEVKKWSQQYSENKQVQDGMNEKMYLQLEFFNKIQVNGELLKKNETEVQEDFKIDIETFKIELLKKSENVLQEFNVKVENDFEEELQGKSNEYIEGFQKEKQVLLDGEVEKESEEFDEDIEVEILEKFQNIEDFEIDVEESEHKLLEDSEELIRNDSKVYIEKSKEEMQDEEVFIQQFDKPSLQETDEDLLLKNKISLQEFHEMDKFKDINEVVEVVEEFEVECVSSVDSIIPTDEEFNPIEESLFTEESSSKEQSASMKNEFSVAEKEFSISEGEFSSEEEKYSFAEEYSATDEYSSEEEFNGVVQQNVDTEEQFKYNENIREFEKELQEFEDLQFKMKIENTQKLDEIPLELKIQQEQFKKKLHQQFNEFQNKFHTNLRVEYDKEQEFKVNEPFNPVLSKVFDEQQQIFYELNDDFHEIKQEYKGFVQQKMFEELQREMNEKLFLESFPEALGDELNLVNEDIHKEFLELQHECYKLEPEFKCNVPLELEENNLCQSLKQESFNLFEKLHCIHKQKLCDFVDSKQWPENCLYPSSLLDSLFENPFEFKPNVLVITLYSIDIGYSIKIPINESETPIETFFNYAEDAILNYVEKEQLPPHLLDILDKAEPKLFYCGCIIAEIHDQKNGIPGKVYRILLRPSNMSIQSDLNQILAENSHINWTYQKRLKLESILTFVSHPVMCMDSSPIAGLTVHLQHQMLSFRSVQLNPLKNDYASSKLKSFDLLDSYSDKLFTQKLSDEQQKISSKRMDTESDNVIIWEFDFCINSFKLLKLFILVIKKTQECSMLLRMNSKVKPFIKIRFKINLETNKLKSYIHVILEILKEKVCRDIFVVRRYKIDDKSTPRSIMCVPTLFNDNIYEPVHADINVLINKLLENKFTSHCDKTKYESGNISQGTLVQVAQTNNAIKRSSKVNKNANQKIKKTIYFCDTKESLRNSNKNLEILNMDLRVNQIQIIDESNMSKKFVSTRTELPVTNQTVSKSSSIKSPPISMILDLEKISSTKESSVTTQETNSCVEPSLKTPVMVVSLSDTNVIQKELNSDTEKMPSVSDTITVMSLLSNPKGLISSGSNHIRVVASNISKKLLSKISSTDCILVSEKLLKLKKEHSENIDTKIKPVININTGYSKYSALNALDSEKQQSSSILHDLKNTSGEMFSKCSNDQYSKKFSFRTHLHTNGICIRFPTYYFNESMHPIFFSRKRISSLESSTKNFQLDRRKKMRKLDILSTVIPRSPNLQVTLPNTPSDLSSLNQVNTHEPVNKGNTDSNLSFSTDSFIKCQSLHNMKSFLVETMSSTNNMANEDSFQEIKCSTSPNIDGYKGVKRKRSTS